MVIDMRKCLEKQEKGECKECMTACHKEHNVPNIGNIKSEIKWIFHETYEHVFPGQHNEFIDEGVKNKPFIALCNHCENPPCVRVCPTKSTWKREDGIIMMDQHRCIGCRFCVAVCPFGAMSFNVIDRQVFKCDLCDGEPQCVRFCDIKAIDFVSPDEVSIDKKRTAAERLSKAVSEGILEKAHFG